MYKTFWLAVSKFVMTHEIYVQVLASIFGYSILKVGDDKTWQLWCVIVRIKSVPFRWDWKRALASVALSTLCQCSISALSVVCCLDRALTGHTFVRFVIGVESDSTLSWARSNVLQNDETFWLAVSKVIITHENLCPSFGLDCWTLDFEGWRW